MIETFLRSTRAQGGVVDRAVTIAVAAAFAQKVPRARAWPHAISNLY